MMSLGMPRRMRNFCRRLARHEGGAVLIYVSIALTVFMGFAALVIDGGRLYTLDTEMQSAADALALAGAAELDGSNDAITRANGAIATLVANNPTFSSDTSKIVAATPVYLKSLPSDDTPMAAVTGSTYATTDPAAARFVAVQLTGNDDRSMDTLFAPAIGGGSTADAGAVAIAGFTSAVCKFTPLFMCNPYEDAGIDTFAEFKEQIDDPAQRHRIIALKKPASGGKYTPGNFGFLDTGADDVKFKQSLGRIDPGACFQQSGVETQTGNIKSAAVPLNTRFDLYANGGEFTKGNADYPPAENVTKGYYYQGNGKVDYCKEDFDTSYTKALGFPSDSVIGSNRMGNGDWMGLGGGLQNYWTVNHPSDPFPPVGKNWTYTGTNMPSRYEVYRWEIENGKIPNNTITDPTLENGDMTLAAKRCSQNPASTAVDRRVLYAAVINCTAEDFSGHKSGIPVVAFIKMFMTQPMTSKSCPTGTPPGQCDTDDTLYVEMIDVVKPGIDDAVVHDIVQLYR